MERKMAFEIKPIKEVAKVFTGKTPSKSVSEYFGGDIPFVTPAELDKGHFVYSSAQTLSKRGAETIKLLPKNSVMVCCIGSLGKIGIAGRKLATNQQINSVVFDDKKVNFKYGFYALSRLKPLMEKIAPITTIPIINKSSFEQLEMPIPPLEQQTHIANILDHATSLIEKRKAQIAELDQLVQSVFLEMFGDPEQGNNLLRIGDLFSIIDGDRGKFYPKSTDFLENGYCLFLNTKNVTKKGFNFEEKNFISQNKDLELRKGKLQRNDIVLTTRGTVGNISIFDESIPYENIRINSGMVILRKVCNDLDKFYFIYAVRYFDFLKNYVSGSAQPQLPISKLKEIKFNVPSIAKQNKFTQVVQKIETQKSQLQASLAELELNYQSLMQRAFRGDL
ncbi:restriction endonuclease subunit S [Actinobacillus equuli subsp. equuli]|uniref:restriction endonuclease subunit S n=1 Tax=Actinobacillus equuli TaxID=718 RepID=UPI002441A6B1|nr:restriction endonuclease subunit S [Actinobacillus equuli]WGE55720.1 restriction endonuclease subunit S [Actinobacillus equuli subsp. equuli]